MAWRLLGFCCVPCVPASCVLIWFVSCPRLMWLLVNLCPAVFVSLSMIYLCIYSPVCSVWFGLVYLLLPGVSESALLCLALMSTLKTIIWVYVLVCVSLFLPAVCTLTKIWVFYLFIYLFIDWLVLTLCLLPWWVREHRWRAEACCKAAWDFLLILLYDVNSVNYLESAGLLGLFVIFVLK